MKKYAFIDLTGKYRYTLSRVWNGNLGRVVFILLNPSTADAFKDDPTVKKCISFAKHWNFGSLEIVNLFAYRSTDAKYLKNISDPVGIKWSRVTALFYIYDIHISTAMSDINSFHFFVCGSFPKKLHRVGFATISKNNLQIIHLN
jgi:hypothetical protein